MGNVTRLVTSVERDQKLAVQEFPGLRTNWDRFCSACQKSLRVGQKECGRGCSVRELNPREREAEVIYQLSLA